MTTAARPTFDTARGGSGARERDLSALSKQYSSPRFERIFKRELEEREGRISEKRSLSSKGHLEYASKKSRTEAIAPPANIDADDPLEASDNSDSSDDEDDDTALLMAELNKIKKEKAVEEAKKEEQHSAEVERIRMENILSGNPLLKNKFSETSEKMDLKVKKRWDDDVVFKNCSRAQPDKEKKNFINDSLQRGKLLTRQGFVTWKSPNPYTYVLSNNLHITNKDFAIRARVVIQKFYMVRIVPKKTRTYPTIEIVGYKGPMTVVASCVEDHAPYRVHPNKLIDRNNASKQSVCSRNVDIPWKRDGRLKLCFQAFLKRESSYIPLCPVVSNIIADSRAHAIPKIHDISDDWSYTDVHFTNESEGRRESWHAKGVSLSVHKQHAISFLTPPYKDEELTHPVTVYIYLYKSGLRQRSEPLKFQFIPPHNTNDTKKKYVYQSIGHSLSSEAMLGSQNIVQLPKKSKKFSKINMNPQFNALSQNIVDLELSYIVDSNLHLDYEEVPDLLSSSENAQTWNVE
ncbi:CWC15 [Lepeophtheirus salmonis]|uniref:CWC15 n=1 Tax=Lepeophtheirus salmonis TaxID=72036 RepID=A0A7R8HCF5_LEPSM|nr:CWC15 [Lepeophtheirus salmonis]CAF3007209.1 CWC15 [Lepeophtheirus salmonis]